MIVGILVGGASSRMGQPKGRLMIKGETLLERTVRVVREAGLEPVMVGADPYPDLVVDVPRIPDALANGGPVGGLAALLFRSVPVIAIACDMPYLDPGDLQRLAEDSRDADVVAAKRDGWEPLFARYGTGVPAVMREYLKTGKRSLRGLLDRFDVAELQVEPERLEDWDYPTDASGRLP